MSAVRIDSPPGIAQAVWLAHLARLGMHAQPRGGLPQEPGGAPGTLIPPAAREAAEAPGEA